MFHVKRRRDSGDLALARRTFLTLLTGFT